MSTKFFSDGDVHAYFNPYENPYQAFLNYMNILSDFELRLNASVPLSSAELTTQNLSAAIEARDEIISKLEDKIAKLEKKVESGKKKEKVAKEDLIKSVKKTSVAAEKPKGKKVTTAKEPAVAVKAKRGKTVTGKKK